MSRTSLAALALLLLAWCCSGPAQESRGTILGRVTDATGAVIPDVEVRAINVATGVTAAARTNDAGNYSIPYLLSGAYMLTAELQGFKKFQREGIQVRVSDTLEVNVQMTLGEVSESVEVTATTPLLDTATATLGQVVDQRRVMELPLQAGNPFELVLLAPGVMNNTNLRLRKAAWNNAQSDIITDGNPQYSNEFTIDGVSNMFSNGSQPRVAFSPPASAVGEFRVQTATYDAGLGHTTGSAINVSTTSGTNRLRGELHHWLSNSALDAQDLFQNRAGRQRPVYQDNRYGFSMGGPVYLPKAYDGRNKTFFFYTWEANKWGVPGTFTGTVPTPAQKGGDFSQLLALGSKYQIYDPATIAPATGGHFSRQPFVGNVIPASRIDNAAKNIMNYWPDPNTTGKADGVNNYAMPTKKLEDYFVHLVRMDHNFSENHRAFLRLHYDWWEEDKNDNFNNIATGIILNRINRGLALDDVVVLGPGTILNIRYGLTQQSFPERRRSRGFDLSSLGFSPALTSLVEKNLATFPNVNVAGYSGFGAWETGDGASTSLIHSLAASLTQLRGNHNLRYGTEIRLSREFDKRFPFDVSPSLTYNATYTNGPLETSGFAPIGQGLASLLLGIPTAGAMQRTASYAEQDKFFALYVQDDWKLTRKLTVNLGLRYEYETPLTERFDRSVKGFAYGVPNPIEAQAKANYAPNQIPEVPLDQFRVQGGLTFAGGSNGRALWEGQKFNLNPRIGLAYELRPGTIFRAGYGIFYETMGVSRSSSIQTGFTQTTPLVATYDNGLTFAASTANPFPNGLDRPLGASGGLTTFLGQTIAYFPAKRVHPYAQRWSLGLQRELPQEFVLDVAYVGNRGTRLQVNRNLDFVPAQYLSTSGERDENTIAYLTQKVPDPFYGLIPTAGVNINRAGLLVPYPHFAGVLIPEPIGYSWFHSMQVRAERRFSRGYTFQLAYTWSKLMEATAFLNSSDPMPYECVSGSDRTQRVAASGIYELPFGKRRRWGSNLPGVLDSIVGGWQISAVVQRQSGTPIGFGNVIFHGNIKDIALPKDQRSVDRWFNVDAGFERDSRRQLQWNILTMPFRFSGVRTDGQAQWNLSAIKNFRINERFQLQFRADAFNAWNHPNLNAPSTNVTSSGFGTISSVSGTPRQFQLMLRLSF